MVQLAIHAIADFKSAGCEFESCRQLHKIKGLRLICGKPFFLLPRQCYAFSKYQF